VCVNASPVLLLVCYPLRTRGLKQWASAMASASGQRECRTISRLKVLLCPDVGRIIVVTVCANLIMAIWALLGGFTWSSTSTFQV
jgi:hypothetical protein